MTDIECGTEQWTELLDALDAHLEATRASLAAGVPEPSGFVLPLPTSPLPAPFADRAQSLLVKTDELAAAVTGELARLRDELRAVPPAELARTGARIDASGKGAFARLGRHARRNAGECVPFCRLEGDEFERKPARTWAGRGFGALG